jgi:hypothetical protein
MDLVTVLTLAAKSTNHPSELLGRIMIFDCQRWTALECNDTLTGAGRSTQSLN